MNSFKIKIKCNVKQTTIADINPVVAAFFLVINITNTNS